MSTPAAGADVTTKGGLTVTNVKMRCPTCGMVSDGVRCPRCNSVKLVACTGACRTCKNKCGG